MVVTTSSPTKKKKKLKTSATNQVESIHHGSLEASSDPASLLERRLYSARKTRRLDFSVSLSHNTSLGSLVVPSQVFPRQIFVHEHSSGHHLREIWLTNHHISVIPAEIAHFPQLRVLGLAGNALSSLPPEIELLTNLEALYLERNNLRLIPEDVVFPRQLRDLRLDHNALMSFPLQITRLRLLNRLGLSHNRLTQLPREMRRLLNLVELDLDHNDLSLEGIPNESLMRLQHLERLGLDGNRLSELPPCLLRMPNVTYVRLNGNRKMSVSESSEDASRSHSVPRRHDGYYQVVEGYQPHKPPPIGADELTSHFAKPTPVPLEGIVPTRAQNLVNALSYREPVALL